MKKRLYGILMAILIIFGGMIVVVSEEEEEWDPSEHRGILYDYKTGEPKAIIVVGENAAESDYNAAMKLARKILERYYELNDPKEPKDFLAKALIWKDSEVSYGLRTRKNQILIGGPGPVVYYDEKELTYKEKEHCNILTHQLIIGKQEDNRDTFGRSMINWYNSHGEYEYLQWGFVKGRDIIIIAGKDREATTRAVDKFIEDTWGE